MDVLQRLSLKALPTKIQGKGGKTIHTNIQQCLFLYNIYIDIFGESVSTSSFLSHYHSLTINVYVIKTRLNSGIRKSFNVATLGKHTDGVHADFATLFLRNTVNVQRFVLWPHLKHTM